MAWNIVDVLLIVALVLAIVDVAVRRPAPLVVWAVIVTDIACLIWRHSLGS